MMPNPQRLSLKHTLVSCKHVETFQEGRPKAKHY